MKIVFQLLILFVHTISFGQVTFQISELPKNTPANAQIYISGNFDAWSGGKKEFELKKDSDSLYSITFAQQTGSFEFKFTKGTWKSVEKKANGTDIENRRYIFGGNGEKISCKIEQWADFLEKNEALVSTANSNVHILSENFEMPQFGRTRRIWVYLPPNYEQTKTAFPVLYMHDGQNLFDQSTSFSTEWQVDECLDQLFEKTGFGLIVVGIDNGGNDRLAEYTPYPNPKYGGGDGKKYIDFVVHTLKPAIDKKYRTLPDKQHTALMGSSLGGLISHYGALEYPQTFGKIGVFSPSFWFSETIYQFCEQKSRLKDTKMYFLAGTKESESMVSDMEKMIKTMKKAGFKKKNIHKKIVVGGKHNEKLWQTELEGAIRYLFEK